MGIKDYLKNLNQDDPSEKARVYDHMYIDCNYMLHYLIYKCRNDFELYARTHNYFEYVFNTVVVNKTINLIFDGEYDKKFTSNPKKQTIELRYKYKQQSDDYDKQPIYPGSKIILTFKDSLVDIIEKYKKINMSKYTINVNSDLVEGEADHKILDLIYESDHDNVCIVSKDSDMVLIAYSLIINKKINVDIMSNLRPIKFIDVNKITLLPKTIYDGDKRITKFGPDYVLIIMLLGNDYLPKISNITYDVIISSYLKYIEFEIKPIISKGKLNPENLIKFIGYIILEKKVKFNFKNLDLNRFSIYYNNLCWTLKQYKIISGIHCLNPTLISFDILNYKQDENVTLTNSIDNIDIENTDTDNTENKNRIRNVINIYNFINHIY